MVFCIELQWSMPLNRRCFEEDNSIKRIELRRWQPKRHVDNRSGFTSSDNMRNIATVAVCSTVAHHHHGTPRSVDYGIFRLWNYARETFWESLMCFMKSVLIFKMWKNDSRSRKTSNFEVFNKRYFRSSVFSRLRPIILNCVQCRVVFGEWK